MLARRTLLKELDDDATIGDFLAKHVRSVKEELPPEPKPNENPTPAHGARPIATPARNLNIKPVEETDEVEEPPCKKSKPGKELSRQVGSSCKRP